GERFVREVVEPAALGVSFHQLLGNRRQLLLEADVRGHVESHKDSPVPSCVTSLTPGRPAWARLLPAPGGADKRGICVVCTGWYGQNVRNVNEPGDKVGAGGREGSENPGCCASSDAAGKGNDCSSLGKRRGHECEDCVRRRGETR